MGAARTERLAAMNNGYGFYAPPPQPPKKGMGTIAILALTFGCLFGGCMVLGTIGRLTSPAASAGAGGEASPTSAPVAKASPAQQAPTPIDAAELFDAYQSNEVAADDRFKGRMLAVRGTVQSIDKDFTGDIVVRLATSNQFMPVDATLKAAEKSSAARLAKGTTVQLTCKGRGMVIGRPQLAGCSVE